MSQTTTDTVVQMYRVYIKATPEAIWEAITSPEWTERYGYPGATSTTCDRAARFARSCRRRCKRWACPRSASTAR